MNTALWLIGLLGIIAFTYKMYSDAKRREREAAQLQAQVEEQIAARQKAIDDKSKQVKEDIDDYFEKRAKWLADRRARATKPTDKS